MSEAATHVRKGFGLRAEVKKDLQFIYASRLVDALRERGYEFSLGGLTIRLAQEFGFCYGVDRAVEYAYETRRKFPSKRILLIGEIIHNPHVNQRMEEMGIELLERAAGAKNGYADVRTGDVVIVPAFGLPVSDFNQLSRLGCTLVDTTCGSVLNVWKNVERYGRGGYTSIIHGKNEHEETIATASRATAEGGHYLVVRDMAEAELLASFLEGRIEASVIHERFSGSTSQGFDPDRDLKRLGLANQTTMLSTESLAIQELLKEAMTKASGAAKTVDNFRVFDTICSATQDRQDAVEAVVEAGVDVMLVIGGYNSSNTGHLVEIAAKSTGAFHIEDASGLVSVSEIDHQPYGHDGSIRSLDWLPEGDVTVGITAGASTPNNRVGEVIERLFQLRGIALEQADLDR